MTDQPLRELRALLLGEGELEPTLLLALLPVLPEQLLGPAIEIAAHIEDQPLRDDVWEQLAYRLAALGHGPEALEAARAIEDEERRAGTLVELAWRLPESLLEEALEAAREIEDSWARSKALTGLASYLAEPELEEAPEPAPPKGFGFLDTTPSRGLEEPLPSPPEPLLPEEPEEALEEAGPAEVRVERAHELLAEAPEDERSTLLKEALRGLQDRVGTQERIVSTGFAPDPQPDAPLEPDTPLACDQSYYFWLEVGSPVAESIEETPTPLPVEHLPPEARLKVALFTFEDEIEITPGADVGELQLLPDGSVRVARQPTQPPVTPQDPDLPKRRLFFPVRAPKREGVFRLRCNIYYEQILVQSRLIHAHTMREPHPVEHALCSVLEYTLTHTLQPGHLTRLAPHRLSLMLNSNDDGDQTSLGTHSFRFFGMQEFKSNASFDGQELQDLIEQARGALRRAAWGDEGPWKKGKSYRYAKPRDLEQLRGDLVRLAVRGYRFYDVIINRLVGGFDQAEELADLMRQSGLVQIAIKGSARYVLPAALVYDYGFDTNADLASYTLCPAFLDALYGQSPLEECECFKGNCPSRGKETVICPSGFWGYRHCLGMPLSVGNAPDAPPEITYQQGPELTVGVSTDRDFRQRPAHVETLQTLHVGLDWNYAATRNDTLRLLKETKPHLVYFYCHGGIANNVPYIQVGPEDERGITRDNLRFKRIRWDDTRPLVFINGCHTTALTPEVALEFVSAFVENAAASGVMGTEITVFEPLACAFAEGFLRRFLSGIPIGEAVRGTRLALLKAGNPLGLVYIPFVMAGLHLVERSTSPE